MATAHAAPHEKGWLSRMMTTDFCPWANRFVYWLKEPVGWFALATLASVLIGLYFSPIGWPLAASLATIIATGMVWPWIAVRVTRCELRPSTNAVHEDDSCRMVVSVHNRLPIPVMGLAIEGYLDSQTTDENRPNVGLTRVPPLCRADYGLEVTPELRGHYPVVKPKVTCSFPFGIWTARRDLFAVDSLTVWPKAYPINGVMPVTGLDNANEGEGHRGGQSGDFVGVRTFRRGDSAKHVNWAASARCESLIVTERGDPQTSRVQVLLDTHLHTDRESLARRVRVATSILVSLHQSRIAADVRLGKRPLRYGSGAHGRRKMLDALADIAIDGEACDPVEPFGNCPNICITGSIHGDVIVRVENPLGCRRGNGNRRQFVFGRHENLSVALAGLWKEVQYATLAI
ncbi:DUF58 domain-containing protein [Rhodopirellula sallentina]|nr:DUF58 domain-containing protein [Rhodopirellula sallentina]